MVILSDWTQDVPAKYGSRHHGINYSIIFRKMDMTEDTVPADNEDLLQDNEEKQIL